MSEEVKRLKKALKEQPERAKPIKDSDWLSLGSATLNLAVSDRAEGGIAKGMAILLVGTSGSGKTWIVLTILAEACRNVNFDNHRIVFDNAERGAHMDLARYFGESLVRRIEPPAGTRLKPKYSRKQHEFYYYLDDFCRAGRPFIYILDSHEALEPIENENKFLEAKKKFKGESSQEVAGSFGVAGAKYNSQNLRRYPAMLAETGSILIILSQTRQKINSPYGGLTRGGGDALKFFADVELWTKVKGQLTKSVNGKERIVADLIEFDVQKNRITGEDSKIVVPFIKRHGFDDVGGCVDFLVEEKHWKVSGGDDKSKNPLKRVIAAPEFDFSGKREALVRKIEEAGDERELHMLAQRVWMEVREASKLKRKSRYE